MRSRGLQTGVLVLISFLKRKFDHVLPHYRSIGTDFIVQYRKLKKYTYIYTKVYKDLLKIRFTKN